MHRSLARYSAPVSFVQAPSWADFITTIVGFEVFGTHNDERARGRHAERVRRVHNANDTVLTITNAAARSISALREKGRGDAVSTVQTAVRAALDAKGARLSESKLLSVSKSAAALASIPRTTVML